jgi:hypothetical protein
MTIALILPSEIDIAINNEHEQYHLSHCTNDPEMLEYALCGQSVDDYIHGIVAVKESLASCGLCLKQIETKRMYLIPAGYGVGQQQDDCMTLHLTQNGAAICTSTMAAELHPVAWVRAVDIDEMGVMMCHVCMGRAG